jgi:Beta-eliminating lyase
LVGSQNFIARARPLRRLLGGNMRQAGVIAAAGLVALDGLADRLADDHAGDRTNAGGLRGGRAEKATGILPAFDPAPLGTFKTDPRSPTGGAIRLRG